MTEHFVVGIVQGPHGLLGEFKVESTSGEYEHFSRIKEVTLTDGNASQVFSVEYTKEAAQTLYMKLVGIDSPEKALRFNRWHIVVPRKYARPLQKGEWYIEDLKGCAVWYGQTDQHKEAAQKKAQIVLSKENTVGKVTNVLEGGQGYLVEIVLSEGCTLLAQDIKCTKSGNPRTVYVPFKDQFIGAVDVEAKTMQLMHLWILE